MYRGLLLSFLLLTTAFICIAQPSIDFSHNRGYYENGFVLTISSDEPVADIYFTTDFSKPTSTNGTLYSSALSLDTTTIIRAVAINSANVESKIVSHSYIFLDDIIAEDYMYDYIKNDTVYGPLLKSSFQSLPVISLVSAEIDSIAEDLDPEIEASSEMFWPNGEREGFMLHNGLQSWGGSNSNPKRNFRLEFKTIYGASKLDYDIFQNDSYHTNLGEVAPAKKFDKLLLRAGSQDGLNGEFGNENLALFIRNRVMLDLMLSMGYPAPHGRFVHVFVNAEYAGQFHLMERPDDSFFESYYGGVKEDYEVYKNGEIWDGPYSFPNTLWDSLDARIDLSTEAEIDTTNTFIDLDQTAAYLLMMSYTSGFDWSETSNCLGGTHINSGIGYKFIPYDMDLSLANGGIWYPAFASDPTWFIAPLVNDGPVPNNLMSELEFKIILGDKMQCECFDDGVFTPSFVDSIFNLRIDDVSASLIAESARWGDRTFSYGAGHVGVTEWDVNDEFLSEKNRVVNNYLPVRTNNLIDYFESINISSNLVPLDYGSNGGHVPSGYLLNITNTNTNSKIYYTTDGSDPRAVGGGVSSSASLYSGPISLPDGIITIKARIKKNTTDTTHIDHWSNMCPKQYLVNQDFSDLVINELHYNPADSIIVNGMTNDTIDGTSFEFMEIKNGGSSSLNLNGFQLQSGIILDITEDIIIPAGGFVTFAEDSIWFKHKYGFSPDGQYSGKLSNGGETILLYDPLFNLIDSVTYDDEGEWPLAPDHGYYSLALLDVNLDNSSADSWQIQPSYHTPGEENFFFDLGAHAYTSIVINEIHYHPPDTVDAAMQPIDGNLFEFIEIKNISDIDIDISDASFTDGIDYTFPTSTIIGAGDFIVLASDQTHFTARYGFAADGQYIGKLSNGGETVELKDVMGSILDVVTYDDKSPWPEEADGLPENKSIALFNPDVDNDDHSVWKIQCMAKQSPGAENDLECYNCASYIVTDQSEIMSSIYNADFIETNGFVPASSDIEYEVSEYLLLTPNFSVELGAIFELMINPCLD